MLPSADALVNEWLHRKLIIGVLLFSGIFIVVAAFLRCILALSSIDEIDVAAIWAVRETVSTPPLQYTAQYTTATDTFIFSNI
jgi:hypothetical protein